MSWADIRNEITAACHEQFAVPATYYEYTSGGISAWTLHPDVMVRFHSRHVRDGDLDREGYAEALEDVNRVVFYLADLTFVPKQSDRIDIGGRVFRLDVEDTRSDDTIAVWHVRESEIPESLGGGGSSS